MSMISRQDGVDLGAGDSFSAFAGRVCRQTYGYSPFARVVDLSRGHFRGPRALVLNGLPDETVLTLAPDGIGTKTILHSYAEALGHAGHDLVAMGAGDITRNGGLPIALSNILEVGSLEEEQILRYLMAGLQQAAEKNRMILLNGETAETGVCVGSEDPTDKTRFNWSAVSFGAYHPARMITGETLAPGQVLIALREYGFRSNGISSVRKAFRLRWGNNWRFETPSTYLTAAARRSTLYDVFLTQLNGWYQTTLEPLIKVHAIAHVTGGSLRTKLGEDILFPLGLSAELTNLWDPPAIMRECAEWRELDGETVVDDKAFYDLWNGGQGVVLAVSEEDADPLIRYAAEYEIEAQVCGAISATAAMKPQVVIESKYKGGIVTYEAA